MFRNLTGHLVAVFMFGLCALLGVMAFAGAVRSLFDGSFEPGAFAAGLAAGVLFGGIGLGVLYALYGHRHLYPMWQRWQFERHAERPWERRRAWRTGRIPYRKPSFAWFLWIFAVGWNAGVWTVLTGNRAMIEEEIRGNGWAILGPAVFVLIGVGVLWGALRSTFARDPGRRALFVMASVPAWTGGILEGTVETRIPEGMKGFVRLKLSCGTGEPMEVEVPPGRLTMGPKGLVFPVALEIPAEAPPTDEFDPKKKVLWKLEARMKLSKGELAAGFPVPVYRRPRPE